MKYRVEWTMTAEVEAPSEEAAVERVCQMDLNAADGPFRMIAVELKEEA